MCHDKTVNESGGSKASCYCIPSSICHMLNTLIAHPACVKVSSEQPKSCLSTSGIFYLSIQSVNKRFEVLLEYPTTTGFQWGHLKNSPHTYTVSGGIGRVF